MSDRKSKRGARMPAKAATLLGVFAIAAVPACGAAAGAATAPMTGIAKDARALGVSMDAGGWITYHDTLAPSLSLITPKVTTVAGAKDAKGRCTFTTAEKTAAHAAPVFEEEIAYNPAACREKVITGALTQAALAKLSALSPSPERPHTTAKPSARPLSVKEADLAHHSAYHKSAWIDPLDITITSLAANISWLDDGTNISQAFGSVSPYQFRWDNWTNSGTPPVNLAFTGSQSVHLDVAETFTNTDFEGLLISLLGAPAIAACGFDTSPAVFHHQEHVLGLAGGGQSGLSLDTKSGGCSDLVHHMDWGGVGNVN